MTITPVESDAEEVVFFWLRRAEIKLFDARKREQLARVELALATDVREHAENQLKAAELILELVKGSYE